MRALCTAYAQPIQLFFYPTCIGICSLFCSCTALFQLLNSWLMERRFGKVLHSASCQSPTNAVLYGTMEP